MLSINGRCFTFDMSADAGTELMMAGEGWTGWDPTWRITKDGNWWASHTESYNWTGPLTKILQLRFLG